MRLGITLSIGILSITLFGFLYAQEKSEKNSSVESQFTVKDKPRTTVQFFNSGKSASGKSVESNTAMSDQGVEQTGYKLTEKPKSDSDYYNELFGEPAPALSNSSKMNEPKTLESHQKFGTNVNKLKFVTTKPSGKSHIDDYDAILKSTNGTIKHSSSVIFNSSDTEVKSAEFQDSTNKKTDRVKTVAQFGQEPAFAPAPPANGKQLDIDEDLDMDEDDKPLRLPEPRLGSSLPTPPEFPGLKKEPSASFDWSDTPAKNKTPNTFKPASTQGGFNSNKNEEDKFQPFPGEQKEQGKDNPFGTSLPEPPALDMNANAHTKIEHAKPNKDLQSAQPEQVQGVISNLAPAGPSSPSVSIHWKKRDEVNVGQPAVCDLVVENTGSVTAENVIVEAQFPETVRLQDANPAPEDAQTGLIWMLGTLNAGSSKTIQVTLIPTKSGDFAATAHVRFTGTTSRVFAVRQPLLKLVIEGPKQVMIGDPAPHTVTITNPGTGIAKNVVIQTFLPEGLDHPKGKELMMQIGSINPGESRTIRLALSAVKGGTQPISVQAAGDAGLKDSASLALNVVAPSLAVAVEGPSLRYKGRAAIYSISIKNTGTISSNNIKLMHKVPVGMDYVASDRGATYDQTTRIVNWFVGRLNVGETTTLMVKLNSADLGEFKHHVRVTSEQGTSTDAAFLTKVEGLASLSVDVADIDDPVEVGEETAYEIKVTNEGSKEATKLVIACEIPEGVQFLSAEGPTEHIVDLEKLAFRPIASLAPGKTITARVIVRGQKAGDARFRVKVTSESINESVQVEELTRYYGDSRK